MSNDQILKSINELADKLSVVRDPANFSAERPFIALPQGYQVHSLDSYARYLDPRADSPRKVVKRIRFTEVESFLDYFTKFKMGHYPVIFSQVSDVGLEVMCVFDYDLPGSVAADGITFPAWNDNRAHLQLAYSRDYKQLRSNSDKWFGQEEFALFVEENTHLFTNPDGATMLELAQSLKGARNVSWQSGKNLHNSTVQIEYIETIDAHTTRGQIVVPQYLELAMPMYEGFKELAIRAAFRWKLNADKKVEFAYRLLTKVAEREAEDEVKEAISKGTGLPLLAVQSFNGTTVN